MRRRGGFGPIVGSCPPVIKQIIFWTLFVGLGCLFLFQKLQKESNMRPRPLWRLLLLIARPRLQLLRCRRLPDNRLNLNRRQYCRHHQL